MIAKLSKNGVGLILLIATLFNLDIDEALANDIVSAVTLLMSIGLLVLNQIERRDIAKFLFRR